MSWQGHLTAHNVLLESLSPLVVKMSGFGLDRTGPLPSSKKTLEKHLRARWLPPEALHLGQGAIPLRWLKEKADVWSLGITAWQIFADGALPYDGLVNEEEIAQQVREEPCLIEEYLL
jgi:hypothetical protein